MTTDRGEERTPLLRGNGLARREASTDGDRHSRYSLHSAPGSSAKPQAGQQNTNGRQYGAVHDDEGHDGDDEQEDEEADPQMPPWRTLIPVLSACWVPVFVSSLDSTIIATLLTSISSDFKSSEQAAWLGSAFLVSLCCFTPIYGRLADIFGRKAALLLALTFFTVGTAMCGIAPSMPFLIAARAIAGMGAGGVTTTASVIMSDLVPLKNRGLLQGLTNIVFGLGSGLGGPVGGFLNDTLGWKQAFLIQLPLLAVAYLLIFVFLENKPPKATFDDSRRKLTKWQQLRRIDVMGSLTLLIGVSSPLIALSLMSANDRPASDPMVLTGLILGPVFIAAFVLIEAKVAYMPILPLRLLKQRTGLSHALANFFLSISSFASLYNIPLYFQAVRLESASLAGKHLIPYSVALSISSVTAGWYMRRFGRFYSYTLGCSAVMCISPAIFVYAIGHAGVPDWCFYLFIVPQGFGGAAVLTTTLIALINSVSRADIAVATSMSYLFRNTGQIMGVSCSGLLLQTVLKKELRKAIIGPGSEETISRIRHETSVIQNLPPDMQAAAIEAYKHALMWVFGLILGASVMMTLANVILERKVLPGFEKKDVEPRNGEERHEEE